MSKLLLPQHGSHDALYQVLKELESEKKKSMEYIKMEPSW